MNRESGDERAREIAISMRGKPYVWGDIKPISAVIPVSESFLEDHKDVMQRIFRKPTPEELAEREERKRQEQAEKAVEVLIHTQRLHQAAGLRKAILDLHGPQDSYDLPECTGCEAHGYEVEATPWPCQTYALARDWRP